MNLACLILGQKNTNGVHCELKTTWLPVCQLDGQNIHLNFTFLISLEENQVATRPKLILIKYNHFKFVLMKFWR